MKLASETTAHDGPGARFERNTRSDFLKILEVYWKWLMDGSQHMDKLLPLSSGACVCRLTDYAKKHRERGPTPYSAQEMGLQASIRISSFVGSWETAENKFQLLPLDGHRST